MENSISKNSGQWLTVQDMKEQAGSLRKYLEEEGVKLSHSKGLEAVARSNGFKDWNTASASGKKRDEFLNGLLESANPDEPPPSFYASIEDRKHHGWRELGQSIRIPGNSAGVLSVVPDMSPFFEPKAVRLYGSDVVKPSVNRRFMVNAVEVGRTPQLASHWPRIASREYGIISDVFNSSGDPLLVKWAICSTKGLARELNIHAFNLHDRDILVSACVWGNPVISLDKYS